MSDLIERPEMERTLADILHDIETAANGPGDLAVLIGELALWSMRAANALDIAEAEILMLREAERLARAEAKRTRLDADLADDVDAAAMRLAREWARQKGGHLIPQETALDDLQDPDFLRALAAAAIREDR